MEGTGVKGRGRVQSTGDAGGARASGDRAKVGASGPLWRGLQAGGVMADDPPVTSHQSPVTFYWPATRHSDAPKLPGRYKGNRKRREPPVVRPWVPCRLCGKRLPRDWEGVVCAGCVANG